MRYINRGVSKTCLWPHRALNRLLWRSDWSYAKKYSLPEVAMDWGGLQLPSDGTKRQLSNHISPINQLLRLVVFFATTFVQRSIPTWSDRQAYLLVAQISEWFLRSPFDRPTSSYTNALLCVVDLLVLCSTPHRISGSDSEPSSDPQGLLNM